MVQITLSGWISDETWRVFLVFARVGTAFMLLPGFGEPGLPPRVKLLAGLGFALTTATALAHVPPAPHNVWGLFFGLAAEATTGALLGVLSRTLVSGVTTAGTVIGQNIGLSNIFAAGLGLEQSATIGAAIYAGMLAVLFAGDGHVIVLRALVGSYDVVPPGTWPEVSASVRSVVSATAQSFALAGQLAMPFLLLALLFNTSLALVNRAMPSIPVFQIGAPALVMIGLYLVASAAPAMLDRALQAYADFLRLTG